MALSRSAARTARQKRWLWALTACGGAAGLMAVEVQLQQLAQEHGQTATEYVQVRSVSVLLRGDLVSWASQLDERKLLVPDLIHRMRPVCDVC